MIRIARSAALLGLLGLLGCDESTKVDVTPSGCETAIDCLVGEVCRDGACVIEGEGGAGGSAAGGAGGSAVGGAGGSAAGGAGGAGGGGGSAAGGAGGSAAGGAGGAGGVGGSAAGGAGGTAAGGAGGQAPTEAERFAARADEIGEAICGLFARCSLSIGPGEVVRCGELLSDPGPYVAAVREGRAAFDEAAFDACLATFAAAPCGPSDPILASCSFLVPLVPHQGACLQSFECADAGFCDVGDGCPGRCLQPAGPGNECNTDQQCAGGHCIDFGCVVDVGEGAACSYLDGPRCALGLACKASRCVGLALDGQPCDETNGPVCASNRYCDGTCQFKLAPGAACETSRQCTAGTSCREAVAGAGMHCEPRGDIGDDCLGGCGYGLMCEGGLCLELPATGAPCTEGCRPDDFCNDAGLCEGKRGAGEPCTQAQQCAGWCEAGGCVGACG